MSTDAEWPCVSVVVSTYNRPVMLRRALESILAQDYSDYEVIVVHDGPANEATIDVCRIVNDSFETLGVTFTFCQLDENSGYQCLPKNMGTSLARGDYIAYLDDDNEWTPDHLRVLVDEIERGDDWPDLVYARRVWVIDPGTSSGEFKLPEGPSEYVPWNDDTRTILASGVSHNFIDTSDFIVTRGGLWRVLEDTGYIWNETLRRFADYELLVRALCIVGLRARSIDKILTYYHWHGENLQMTRPYVETPIGIRI